LPCAGKTAEEYEAGEAERREKVVSSEEGCLLYQLVKNKDKKTGDISYFVLELYKDKDALDTHFKNMGAKGAIPLSKIKYDSSPLQIFPVVGGFQHQVLKLLLFHVLFHF
jgi:quinol monooxygenase YgiN